jgi:hypothetical protein
MCTQNHTIEKFINLRFGGWNGWHSRSDLYSYDIVSKYWEEIIPAHKRYPSPLRSHGSACIDGVIWVFGGVNNTVMGELWKYDISNIFPTIFKN